MKLKGPQLKKRRYSQDKKNKIIMITWDDSYNENSCISNYEQANICLMVDTDNKAKVKTCSKSDTSFCATLDDEEEMTYDVLLQSYHMISL